MKKIVLVILVFALSLGIAACSKETVKLRCDGENCDNYVEVAVENGKTPDESWVVFCKTCSENVLSD